MDYKVDAGLYSVNHADAASPVLVTSNYKLTFDEVRRTLGRRKAWILVLDTNGVNVWCAAGKGTFGTSELEKRISVTNLAAHVDHRNLVLPQLGATGVDAKEIRKNTGWRVVWGPVSARDLPRYLDSGSKKTDAMRTVSFGLRDRIVLAPMELVHAAKWLPFLVAGAAVLALPNGHDFLSRFVANTALVVGALAMGGIGIPALLPWLPFKAFGLKGLALGGVGSLGIGIAAHQLLGVPPTMLWAVGVPATALVVWMAMNFTGCSTFTSQSGAELEVRVALKPLIGASTAGIVTGLARAAMAWAF